MKRLALSLLLLSAPAMAQDTAPETIEVIGARTLVGIWKIHFPPASRYMFPAWAAEHMREATPFAG